MRAAPPCQALCAPPPPLSSLQVRVADVFAATLADLLAILEKATSGETGIHASGAPCSASRASLACGLAASLRAGPGRPLGRPALTAPAGA